MRHVREFAGYGIRFHHIAMLVLIPAPLNQNLSACPVLIAVSVQVNKHTALVSRYVIAIFIHKVKHHIAVLIKKVYGPPDKVLVDYAAGYGMNNF